MFELPLATLIFENDFMLRHVVLAGIFVLLALGLNLINGFGGMLLLGHHGFWAVGAFMGAAAVIAMFPTDEAGNFVELDKLSWNTRIALMLICVGVGTLAAMICGFLIGLPCLQLRGDYLAIATLGFGQIVFAISLYIIENRLKRDSIVLPTHLPILDQGDGRLTYAWAYVAIVWVAVALTAVLVYFLIKSTHGRAILALREDEIPAELSGVNTKGYKLLVFVIGAGIAGFAGGLFVLSQGSIEPRNFVFLYGVIILMMVLLGGQGSITGAILGAIILYSLRELFSQNDPVGIATDITGMVGYTLVFLTVLVASQALSSKMRTRGATELSPAVSAQGKPVQWSIARWGLVVFAAALVLPLPATLFATMVLGWSGAPVGVTFASLGGMALGALALLSVPAQTKLRPFAGVVAALFVAKFALTLKDYFESDDRIAQWLTYLEPASFVALLLMLLAIGLRLDRTSVKGIAGASLLLILLYLGLDYFNSFELDLRGLTQWWQVIFAALLVILMLNAPHGIMGRKEIHQTSWWQVLFRRPSPAELSARKGYAMAGAAGVTTTQPEAETSERYEPPRATQPEPTPPQGPPVSLLPTSLSSFAPLAVARWVFLLCGLLYFGASVAWIWQVGWGFATTLHLMGSFLVLHAVLPAFAFPFHAYAASVLAFLLLNGFAEVFAPSELSLFAAGAGHGLLERGVVLLGLLAATLLSWQSRNRIRMRRHEAQTAIAHGAYSVAEWRRLCDAHSGAHGADDTAALPILDIRALDKQFGGLTAVNDFEITLRPRELVGLIGPNGAGKTTVFNLLTGIYAPTSGTIVLNGTEVQGRKPYEIVLRGVARTFQNIRLFRELTVLQNVRIAFNPLSVPRYWHDIGLSFRSLPRWFVDPLRREREFASSTLELEFRFARIQAARGIDTVSYGLAGALLRTKRFRKAEAAIERSAMELLRIFNLEHRAHEPAASLPYGEQRRLEIARALATQPRLLILDEPAAGMNPQETENLMHLIRWVQKEFDLTILLIEHDMSLVMNICERIVVIDHGEVIARGLPAEIQRNPEVIKAYLGEEAAEQVSQQQEQQEQEPPPPSESPPQ